MPHTDETFFKMKVGWTDDPKVEALGRFGAMDACLARYVFMEMIDYARAELTDGLVPAESLGRIGYPLTPDDAMRLAMLLAEAGPFGSLVGFDASSNAFRILAYARWNDTREEVQARKDKAGKAARKRWESAGARGNARDATSTAAKRMTGNARDAEQEQETESPPRPPAHDAPGTPAKADDDDDLHHQIVALLAGSGHTVTYAEAVVIVETMLIGRKPRDPRAYVLRSVRNDPAAAVRLLVQRRPAPVVTGVQRVLADAHRPGGPATDDQRAARAAEARRGIGVQGPEHAEAQRIAGVRMALDEAAALDPEPEPAPAEPEPETEGVDASLPDW